MHWALTGAGPLGQSGSRSERKLQRGSKAERDVGSFWFLFVSRKDLDEGRQTLPVKGQMTSVSDLLAAPSLLQRLSFAVVVMLQTTGERTVWLCAADTTVFMDTDM